LALNVLETAKARYTRLESIRNPYLDRAQECAKLTIPSLIPPQGSSGSTKLPTPYQSMGARGVNNLAAKLLLALLPPNSPFFRYVVDDFMMEKLTGREGMRAQVEEALDKMERAVMAYIEAGNTRSSVFEAMKLLLVSGNVLIYVPPKGGMKVFRLDHFVVKRDPMGHILEMVTKEDISPLELPESIRVRETKESDEGNGEDSRELYTRIKRTLAGWEIFQEVDGIVVPGTEGTYPADKCPWLALRFIKVDGEDYGRSYVEEYLGDLKTLEGLRKAIVKASAAAAKVLFLVKPNGTTKMKTLAESDSGDIKEGNAEDVSVLQMDKYADFRVAKETIDDLQESLAYAFLLNSAIQRSGERVTAEEIRYMANELEQTLGGVYSTLAQEFQLPYIQVVQAQMERQGLLPALPKNAIKPAITTGINAIGRGNDLTKLAGLLQDLAVLGPEVIAQEMNVSDFIKRCGAARGIDMKGLIPTEAEKAARMQQTQQSQMMAQLGPNAVNQLGGLAKESMKMTGELPSIPQ
jgi:hypothetical protein